MINYFSSFLPRASPQRCAILFHSPRIYIWKHQLYGFGLHGVYMTFLFPNSNIKQKIESVITQLQRSHNNCPITLVLPLMKKTYFDEVRNKPFKRALSMITGFFYCRSKQINFSVSRSSLRFLSVCFVYYLLHRQH